MKFTAYKREKNVTKYRDLLVESEGLEIGSVVGCGLDRVKRPITGQDIKNAIQFYEKYKEKINSFPISARRQSVQEFVEGDGVVPSYIQPEK